MNEWLLFSLAFLFLWAVIYAKAVPEARKEMLLVSIFTVPLGLLQPLFVPEYWNPPSLFNLAAATGFDIESVIFSFSTGGIAAVLYESMFGLRHGKIRARKVSKKRETFHRLTIASPVMAFLLLFFLTDLNPIYSVSIALLAGGILAILCRPDLKKNILASGLLFSGLYFLFFFSMVLAFPGFTSAWNLAALSGMLVLGVPMEELMFAFAFGMLWSGIYEHVMGYRLKG